MCGYFCTGFIDFIIADKKLTDFTGMFSPRDFAKKMTVSFLVILKMNGINRTNLADQTKFRLKEINKIEITKKLIKESYAVKNYVNM